MNWLTLQLFSFCLLVLLAAFFSATEVAYTGLTVSQIKRVKRTKPLSLALWEKNSDLVLATLLISGNAVNAAVGVIAADTALGLSKKIPLSQSVVTLGIGLISASLILLFGEILPKVWAKHHTISWSLRITPWMNAWNRLMAPIARASVWITNLLIHGVQGQRKNPLTLHETELRRIFTHSVLSSNSKKIMDNVLDFAKLSVRAVMIPRSEIFGVSMLEPMNKIIEKAIASGLSRIPVYSSSIDKIAGLLYSKDLLLAWRNDSLVVLSDLLRPVHFVHPDLPLADLIRVFKSGRHHMALVKDDATPFHVIGLVTLQDALEAIVGEIKDEL